MSPFVNVLDDVRPLPVLSLCSGNTPLRVLTAVLVAAKSDVPAGAPFAATELNGTGYTVLSNVIEPVLPLTPALSLDIFVR